MKKTLFIISFSITLNASIFGVIFKNTDSLWDDLFKSSKSTIDDTHMNSKLSMDDTIEIFTKDYSIKWENESLNKIMKETNNTCNREIAKNKGKPLLEKYIQYQKAFYQHTLTEKILHEEIIQRLNASLIKELGIKKISITTKGTYPYLNELTIQLFSICGYELKYDILDLNFSLTDYRIKSNLYN